MKAWSWLLPLALGACTGAPGGSDKTAAAAVATHSTASPAAMLKNHHWQLSDAVDGDNTRMEPLFGKSDKPLQLDFADQRVSVSNACNAISGEYRIVDGHLDVKALMQTMMACMDPTLQQRETVIKQVLQARPSVIVSTTDSTPKLVLVTSSGQTLTFTGAMTDEARYGGPAETVFLEVTARSVPCDSPTGADTPCLRVRERHYGSNGVSSGAPGTWHVLRQPIEDFTPQAGVRYVLRLKRYTRKSSSGDSSAAYVLDSIVESGPAQPAL